jgi:hypothetical protein
MTKSPGHPSAANTIRDPSTEAGLLHPKDAREPANWDTRDAWFGDARYGAPGGVVLCGSGWWRNTPLRGCRTNPIAGIVAPTCGMSTRIDFDMLRCRDAESDSCDILLPGNMGGCNRSHRWSLT